MWSKTRNEKLLLSIQSEDRRFEHPIVDFKADWQ